MRVTELELVKNIIEYTVYTGTQQEYLFNDWVKFSYFLSERDVYLGLILYSLKINLFTNGFEIYNWYKSTEKMRKNFELMTCSTKQLRFAWDRENIKQYNIEFLSAAVTFN